MKSLTARQLAEEYFNFFKKKGHVVIPSVPLVPENDPTALFISAGMHPLVTYLLGESNPEGKRLASVQRCLRTGDIDDVGDETHHTFFEMLGNWSLGDYWKKEAIEWSFEFLTEVLGIGPERLAVTVFAGDNNVSCDEESAKIWENVGISRERIFYLPKEDNWWGPAGRIGPCGPDSEMFVDVTGRPLGESHECRPGDGCGRWAEVWNDVFMEYNKTAEGKYESLRQRNVDTGMGVERMVSVLSGLADIYESEIWKGVIGRIEEVVGRRYEGGEKRAMRTIADHVRAAVFLTADGVEPGNKERGYVLRRLLRRAVRYGRGLGVKGVFCVKVGEAVMDGVGEMAGNYEGLFSGRREKILAGLAKEEERFSRTLGRGLKVLEKQDVIDGRVAFDLYQSYGFPLELTKEIAEERGAKIDEEGFGKEFERHQKLSRTASVGRFKGGLADSSERVVRMHTATHLLHMALREVLGSEVRQAGSNITDERLRFDFSFSRRMTREERERVEEIVNGKVGENLPVTATVEEKNEAIAAGASAFFPEKYPDKVKVYTIGSKEGEWWSRELCGGPHVERTGLVGRVRITRDETIGLGRQRIYATVD